MNSVYHAKSSAKQWGGNWEEYLPIHDYLDQAKVGHGTVKHRAILHHTVGCSLCVQNFGPVLTLSTGRDVPVKEIAERHIVEDVGFLPTPDDYLKCINLKAAPWMGGSPSRLEKAGVKLSPSITRRIKESKKS